MSYRIGLVGKPSVGKSSFFNAATTNDVPEGAYPFTTIDPIVGEAYVRVECAAPEFDTECAPSVGFCDGGTRFVPVKLVDVAGLIPGAHEGKGLGNQFLTDLNETDVLLHVVDFSGETDAKGEPTEGHDPRDDIDFLEDELDMWYLDILEKGIQKYENRYGGEDVSVEGELAEQMSAFRIGADEITQVVLSLGLELDPAAWSGGDSEADAVGAPATDGGVTRADDEATKTTESRGDPGDGSTGVDTPDHDRYAIAREIRKRTKPLVVVANKMDKPTARENYEAVTSDPEYDHLTVVPASAHAEKALKKADRAGAVAYRPGDDDFEVVSDVSEEQAAGLDQIREFVADFGGTGVQLALETALFDELGTIAVFPGSATEAGEFRDCFVLPGGSTTEDFAYHIHSDIGDGLLHGLDCRSDRQIGKGHELTHRDVVELVSTN